VAIRLLIVDDHQLVRSGLRRLLETEEDIEVEDEAGTAYDAVRLARLHKPDVILLDVVMPGGNGIDAIPDILEASPSTQVLALSMQDDPSYVRQAFAFGAKGYVLKEAADDELLAAIREVAKGGNYVDHQLGSRLAAYDVNAAAAKEADPLSEREREVLKLLALGYTNQEIGKKLFISVRTVDTHRAHIMRKLQLDTRAELVMFALANGVIGPDAG
jgi:DNA-binding NarL/FixJ family response regulator